VAEVVNELGNYERHFGRRKRRRRPDDQKTFEASVVAVVSILIHRELTERGAKLAVSHSNQLSGCAWPPRGREEVPVAAVFATHPDERPKGTTDLLPKDMSASDVLKAICSHHRPIAHLLCSPEPGRLRGLLLRVRDNHRPDAGADPPRHRCPANP